MQPSRSSLSRPACFLARGDDNDEDVHHERWRIIQIICAPDRDVVGLKDRGAVEGRSVAVERERPAGKPSDMGNAVQRLDEWKRFE